MADPTQGPGPVNATSEIGNGGHNPKPAPAQASPQEPPLQSGSSPLPSPEPSVATTLHVEASATSLLVQAGPAGDGPNNGEGGEWELLLQKLREWLNQGQLKSFWAQASRPVSLLAGLVGLLIVLRIYGALLGAIDSLPLVPGLLELAGVIWLVRYGLPKLLRSSEREQLLGGLSQRWRSFRGQG